ncbi:related to Nucleolar complex protein 4 [Saccharomycodes ludwigii]|uniref:Related to Nucleolar complex protein 4 n=1 Tax=Saccharomycodes ludwigii TaxID=36035 RepID=A0A376B8K9_9ASCO|nr:related to Nucleolar complex protein 4 [Saccharomycodes ludwigii]
MSLPTINKEEIKGLITSIYQDKKNYNNIVKLLNIYSKYPPESFIDEQDGNLQTIRYLTLNLFKIFKKLAELNLLSGAGSTANSNEKILIQWCRKNYELYKSKILLDYMTQIKVANSLSLDCLDIYMNCIELESIYFSSKRGLPYFPNRTLQKLISRLLFTGNKGNDLAYILDEFADKYYKKYVDVQFYFQNEFNNLITDGTYPPEKNNNLVKFWIKLMNHDNHYDSDDCDLEILVPHPPSIMENEHKFKDFVENNWLFILSKVTRPDQYKIILLILHKRIIPHFNTPSKLMDFLTESYNLQYVVDDDDDDDDDNHSDNNHNNNGSIVIPLLALNGLFELMKNYNLEYPNFYFKLYQLFTPDMMHVKYRSRFLRLSDIFLSSTHLSAQLVASFIKKMARLTVNASTSAIISIIPFIYNLLKKHPTCMIMLHDPQYIKTPGNVFSTNVKKMEYIDPFDNDEKDPESTNAIESSLWELETLMHHYHPNVASLAKIFKNPFRKYSYNLEDFLDWNYDTLLKAELKRSLKILPALNHEFTSNGSNNADHKKKYTVFDDFVQNVAF